VNLFQQEISFHAVQRVASSALMMGGLAFKDATFNVITSDFVFIIFLGSTFHVVG